MKKFVCIVTVLAICLTLFGCGSKNENKDVKNGSAETSAETKVTESKSLSGIELGVMGVLGKTYAEIRDMSGAPGNKITEDGEEFYKFNGSEALYAFGEAEEDDNAEKKENLKSVADKNDIKDGAKCVKAVCKVEDIMKLGGESYSVLAVEQYVNVSLKEKAEEGGLYKLVYENNFMTLTFYSASEDALKGSEKAVAVIK